MTENIFEVVAKQCHESLSTREHRKVSTVSVFLSTVLIITQCKASCLFRLCVVMFKDQFIVI